MFSRFCELHGGFRVGDHSLNCVDIIGEIHFEQIPTLNLGEKIVMRQCRTLGSAKNPHAFMSPGQTALLEVLRNGARGFFNEKLNFVYSKNHVTALHCQPAKTLK